MAERFAFEAIGTAWVVDIHDSMELEDAHALETSIRERIRVFDQTYSRFREDSLVAKIEKQEGVYAFPEDAAPLFALYEKVYWSTFGRVTPLIGSVLVQAGYDAHYSLKEGTLTIPKRWEQAMRFDYETNELHVFVPGVLLDFGAAGKGYLIDIVSDMIEDAGFLAYTVDAGGDIRHRGEPIRVALEHPDRLDMAVGVASLANESICGSAGNRRRWGRFHHIIDPTLLESPKHIIAVWTTAGTTMLADAMTTAMMFTDAETLRLQYAFEYLVMYADYSFKKSPGFGAEIFH